MIITKKIILKTKSKLNINSSSNSISIKIEDKKYSIEQKPFYNLSIIENDSKNIIISYGYMILVDNSENVSKIIVDKPINDLYFIGETIYIIGDNTISKIVNDLPEEIYASSEIIISSYVGSDNFIIVNLLNNSQYKVRID